MKDFGAFLIKIIDKFDIKKLIISLFVVLAFMVVPKINFLNFLMPLDDAQKLITFVFALLLAYIVLLVLTFVFNSFKRILNNRPKKTFKMLRKYSEYINIFYSEDIGEYSSVKKQYSWSASKDIISKLVENNIIEKTSYTSSEYRLNTRAKNKLNRLRKFLMFIDRKFLSKIEVEDKSNGQA